MLESLLLIVGTYCSCALAVHAAYLLNRKDAKSRPRHLVLVTHNQQHRVEWVLRSFMLLSWLKGKAVRLTVFDCGSTDDTAAIVRRLAVRLPFSFHMVGSEKEIEPWLDRHFDADTVILHLRHNEDVSPQLVFS